MAIYPIACKEMATRRKNLYLWMITFHFKLHQLLSSITSFKGEFCRPSSYYTMAVYIYTVEACIRMKASFLAFAFTVQTFYSIYTVERVKVLCSDTSLSLFV